jgi:hypothetical protein
MYKDQRYDWVLKAQAQFPVTAKIFSLDFSRLKYLDIFQLDCFNGKK